MPSSVRAQTTARSDTVPLVIQRLLPFNSQRSPCRTALVIMPPAWLPKSGSVSPKQPIFCPAASFGSHSCFCCSLP